MSVCARSHRARGGVRGPVAGHRAAGAGDARDPVEEVATVHTDATGGPGMDATDRAIVNALQRGLAVCDAPFEPLARALGIEARDVVRRIDRLLAHRVLSRFGPMFDAERMGGAFCLCALSAPPEEFERVAACVNAFPEVAHNYERDHQLNMWFVLATDTPRRIAEVVAEIEAATGCPVLSLPKLEEFHVGLYLEA